MSQVICIVVYCKEILQSNVLDDCLNDELSVCVCSVYIGFAGLSRRLVLQNRQNGVLN